MQRLQEYNQIQWNVAVSPAVQQTAIAALESGKVLYFPQLPFELTEEEQRFLLVDNFQLDAKNISYNFADNSLKNIRCTENLQSLLQELLKRYAQYAQQLLLNLAPGYQTGLRLGRTSFRPIEIAGRKTSYRKDDTRLHIDAFPASPNQGQRILRLFTNINPQQPRIWRIGEPFSQVLKQFSQQLKPPFPGTAKLLHWLKLTRGYRTLYDHYMLQLHNAMKADLNYQRAADQQEIAFPAGSSWMVYTDLVSHAAMKGQFVLEQTFYLPVQVMQEPLTSPLKILENFLHKKLSFA